MLTRFRPRCGASNKEDAEQCENCGADIRQEHGDFVENLIHFSLKHPVAEVAQFAAETLGKIGDRRAVEPLIEVLETPHELGLMEAATEALGRLGDPRAVPALSHVLEKGPLAVRLKAVTSLGQIGGEDAARALKQAASKDANKVVRDEAAKALETIGATK